MARGEEADGERKVWAERFSRGEWRREAQDVYLARALAGVLPAVAWRCLQLAASACCCLLLCLASSLCSLDWSPRVLCDPEKTSHGIGNRSGNGK